MILITIIIIVIKIVIIIILNGSLNDSLTLEDKWRENSWLEEQFPEIPLFKNLSPKYDEQQSGVKKRVNTLLKVQKHPPKTSEIKKLKQLWVLQTPELVFCWLFTTLLFTDVNNSGGTNISLLFLLQDIYFSTPRNQSN